MRDWFVHNPTKLQGSMGFMIFCWIGGIAGPFIAPFITWTFLRLYPELPNQYFVQTERCFWLVSLGDCLCWMQDTD